MKRVLFIINFALVNAGVPNVLMQIVRKLHNECTFDVIVNGSNKAYFDDEFISYGGKIYRMELIDYSKNKIRYVKNGKLVYNKVREVLKENEYDAIHCNNGFDGGYAIKAAYDAGVPIRVFHAHGTYRIKGKNVFANAYKRKGVKLGVKYATNCIACSNVAGETLFAGNAFENVFNPLDVKKYLSIDKVKHSGVNLLQIGYFNELKNQIFSLKVLKKLLSNGCEAKLDLIGYDVGGYLNKIKEFIYDNKLEEYVNILPSDYKKEDVLDKADFLLLPSASEGLPLTALEAQISHTYCIASEYVPNDCDMGMCTFLPIHDNTAVEQWVQEIENRQGYCDTLNYEKIKKVDVEFYVENIKSIYFSQDN